MRVKAWAAACLGAAAVAMASAQIDDPGSRESVLEALRRQRAEAEAGRWAPTPLLAAPGPAPRRAPVEGEQPCVTLQQLSVTGLRRAERPLLREFEPFAGGCLGAASLEALRENLDRRLAEEGLITSRVILPPQALAEGRLVVQVVAGRVEALVAAGPDGEVVDDRRWRHALALDVGEVLDAHRLDAALDHFNRLGGAPARFRLEPGTADGSTRIVLLRGAPAAPQLSVAADNGGSREFGRGQVDLDLRLDEPLGLLDQLRVTAGSNADPGRAASRSAGLHYSLPWREHLFAFALGASWRRQPVQGTTLEFESRGRDRTVELRWDWAAWRSAEAKLGPWIAWRERRTRSDLDGTELVVQRRHRLLREFGLQWWQQAGAWRWSLDASHGEGRRRGAPNPFVPNDGVRTRIDRVQARLSTDPHPDVPGWQIELRAQHGRQPGSGADLFVIGSPASVRGHRPEEALAAESGALARVELAWATVGTDAIGAQPYLGWDVGLLYGPSAVALPQRRLAAATAGLRLAIAGRLQADLSLSLPSGGPPGTTSPRWRPALVVRTPI